MKYRISTVSELTKIPRNTLIAWERRYGIPQPARGENGYRAYDEEDISTLIRIKDAVDSGLAISEAIVLLERDPPQEGVPEREPQAHSPRSPSPRQVQVTPSAATTKFEPEAESARVARLVAALTRYNRREAESILMELHGLPYDERIERYLFPALVKIGSLWESGKVSIAQEHFASTLVREHLSWMLMQVGQRAGDSPLAVTTTFPGEEHELAALALAVRAGLLGYQVTHLGANLPAEELGDYCRKLKPSLVLVSLLRPTPRQELQRFGRTLRVLAPATVRLVVGGRGVDTTPKPVVTNVEFVARWSELQLLPPRNTETTRQ